MTLRQPTQLRLGRLALLIAGALILVLGGLTWVLTTQSAPLAQVHAEAGGWPVWQKHALAYAPAVPTPQAPTPIPHDATAEQLAALRAQLAEQQHALLALKEALRHRPATTPPAPKKAAAPMLFVSESPKGLPETPAPNTYTLAPGATKLPCLVETVINSEVEGYFTAKISTNVYDTATGRHLLIPQGSTILGKDSSADLLYGNERLPTLSLSLALPDGRTVDLGQSPVTDQRGITGLTGKVDQHYWRLFSAVFIGGALRGGTQLLQTQAVGAGGVGQVAGGIAATGNQVTQQRLGRALDTRPTIEVAAGQQCHVLLVKPLTLAAMWQ